MEKEYEESPKMDEKYLFSSMERISTVGISLAFQGKVAI